MPQDDSAVADLMLMRDALVARRREAARAAAATLQDGSWSVFGPSDASIETKEVVEVQRAIDAIDRAIEDESAAGVGRKTGSDSATRSDDELQTIIDRVDAPRKSPLTDVA